MNGYRCSCAAFVLPGEAHRCFYSEALEMLLRIAVAVEVHTQAKTGYPPLRKVTREEWAGLSPLARQGAYVE